MSTHIKVTHSDTEITYNEQENKWTFTLRGRDRSADSLAKAKEIIDKPVPADKAKPFEKIPAWFFWHTDLPQKIEVTGIAEKSYGSLEYVWVNNAGKRSKEYVNSQIYPANNSNDLLIAQIVEKEKEAAAAKSAAYKLKNKLQPLVIAKED